MLPRNAAVVYMTLGIGLKEDFTGGRRPDELDHAGVVSARSRWATPGHAPGRLATKGYPGAGARALNVALLYHDEGTLAGNYPEDSSGRDDNGTVPPVAEALAGMGHNVKLVNMTLDAFERLRGMDIDVAFNLCDDGFGNENATEPHVAAVLDILGLTYTGSGCKAMIVCLDKALAKRVIANAGLPTPGFYLAESESDLNHGLKYPLIVKPSSEDASIGIRSDSVASSEAELKKLVARVVRTYKQPALVEEYISGREFNVAILGNDEPRALPISEIEFDGLPENKRIVSYDAKWAEGSEEYRKTVPRCPAKISDEMRARLVEVAIRAYKLLGIRGYGRVDIRADETGPYILEVNPNPDLGMDAGFFRSAKAAGMTYPDLVKNILDLAVEGARNGR